MIHGGDLLSYEDYFDGDLVDYSSNINPLGIPEGLKEKVFDNFQSIEAYPDIEYRELKKSIGEYLECETENILVGNGAMEIIDLFNLWADRVITTEPAFIEYKLRGQVHGKQVIEIGYTEDFQVDLEKLEDTLREKDLLIIGNPNNPTGLRIEEEKLIQIYKLVQSRGAYMLLDEAFFEFAPEDYDSVELFKSDGYKNVGIIRAATKFFAIPGLRLGYGCVSKEMAEKIESLSMPWSVNSLAETAGRYIFKDKEYIQKSKKYIDQERSFLLEELEKIEGLKAFNTHTNYILIRLEGKTEDQVFESLLKRGFVIRKCSSFRSLGKNHIRIAIKDRENNVNFLKALREIEL